MGTPSKRERNRRAEVKVVIDYDPDPPRCTNCTSYGKPVDNWMCMKHSFPSSGNAVCNDWAGRDGSLLAGA